MFKFMKYMQIILIVSLCYISVGDTFASTFVVNDLDNSPTVNFHNVSISENPILDKPFNVSATIEAPGPVPRHIILYLSVPSGINFISPAILDLGNLSEKDGEKVTNWKLVALKPGSFNLNISAYSIGSNIQSESNSDFTSFPIDVSVGFEYEGEPYFQIKSTNMYPTLTYPETIGNRLSINVLSVGNVVANNVSAEVKLPESLTLTGGSPNSFYIGRMLPGENFTVSYYINIGNNLTSNVIPVSLILKYSNGSAILDTAILVAPKANFGLIDVLSTDQLYPGATNVPFRVVLRNTGDSVAETLTAKLLGGNTIPGVRSSLQTSIGDVENVGNIAPNETFTNTFIINVDPTATAGTQSANIELAWSQDSSSNTNQENTFVQTIPLTYNIESGPNYLLYYNGIPWIYIFVAVLIGLAIVIFFVLRRRRIRSINSLELQDSSREGGSKSPIHKD